MFQEFIGVISECLVPVRLFLVVLYLCIVPLFNIRYRYIFHHLIFYTTNWHCKESATYLSVHVGSENIRDDLQDGAVYTGPAGN